MKARAGWTRTALAAAVMLALAGTVRAGSIIGRVLDSSGRPVSGAKVQWLAYRGDDEILLDQTTGADPSPIGEMATDEQGRFRVVLDKPGVSVALGVLRNG